MDNAADADAVDPALHISLRPEQLKPDRITSYPISPQSSPTSRKTVLLRSDQRHLDPTAPRQSTPADNPNALAAEHFVFPAMPLQNPSTSHSIMDNASRTRRSSSLVHEIQPPARRLSSHQMLLLTPFGGPIPSGAMAATGMDMSMSRGRSSMGDASGRIPSLPWLPATRTASGSVMLPVSTESTATGGFTMTSSPSSQGESSATGLSRSRHLSLINSSNPSNPSPLSQPLTTIPSAESGSSSNSQQSRAPTPGLESDDPFTSRPDLFDPTLSPDLAYDITAVTVPMMRSNSLPIMTLRELEAMKEKDSELGLAKSHFAWVSREPLEDEIDIT